MTGTLEAVYLMMSGGVVPGGSCRSCVCAIAATCAIAVSMFALGWKKTLMTAMPRSDCDSMCSMSLTVVVRPRSLADDALAHLLGRQAVVVPDDADHRDVDVREDVGRRAQDGERADDRMQDQRHHDERVGAAERESNDPHCGEPCSMGRRPGERTNSKWLCACYWFRYVLLLVRSPGRRPIQQGSPQCGSSDSRCDGPTRSSCWRS